MSDAACAALCGCRALPAGKRCDIAAARGTCQAETSAPTRTRQVSVDVPRTAPNVPFFHEPPLQKSLERMLYIWGIR